MPAFYDKQYKMIPSEIFDHVGTCNYLPLHGLFFWEGVMKIGYVKCYASLRST